MAGDLLDEIRSDVAVIEKPSRRAFRSLRRKRRRFEPRTFYEASVSQNPMLVSDEELAHIREIRKAATENPEAYLEARRAEAG